MYVEYDAPLGVGNIGLFPPLPMNAYTGTLVLLTTPPEPPTVKLVPFHPIALAPGDRELEEISGKSFDDSYISFQFFPSADVAIVARLPLPTATQRCPLANVFLDEYAVHFIPSLDHAITFPAEVNEYAGPVAIKRFPFQQTDFTPNGNKLLEPGTPRHFLPVYAYSAGRTVGVVVAGVSVEYKIVKLLLY